MKIKSEHLVIGDKLSSPVFLHTKNPIVDSGKKVTFDELRRLQRFLIKEVEIEPRGKELEEAARKQLEAEDALPSEPIEVDRFAAFIASYDKAFTSWEQGMPPNIYEAIDLINRSVPDSIAPDEILPYFLEKGTEAYTVRHAIYRGALAQLLAERTGRDRRMVLDLWTASYFADCGLARLMEWRHSTRYEAMKQEIFHRHPAMAFQLLQKETIISDTVRRLIVQHHERLDGSGYPLKVNGDKITDHARLFIVADVFAAMTSWRPYREAHSPWEAYRFMKARPHQFDETYTTLLGSQFFEIKLGDRILLTDGKIGQVVEETDEFDRPVVSYDHFGQTMTINLKEKRQTEIMQIL